MAPGCAPWCWYMCRSMMVRSAGLWWLRGRGTTLRVVTRLSLLGKLKRSTSAAHPHALQSDLERLERSETDYIYIYT